MYCSTIVLVQLAWFWLLSVLLISFDADDYQWSITLLISYPILFPVVAWASAEKHFSLFQKKHFSHLFWIN